MKRKHAEKTKGYRKECPHPPDCRLGHPSKDITWHCQQCGYIEKKSYKEQIIAKMDQQEEKGRSKYGQLLEDAGLKQEVLLEHAQEELVDLLYYLVGIQDTQKETIRLTDKESKLIIEALNFFEWEGRANKENIDRLINKIKGADK